jgi:thiol-disulfide isomerase/thioredoxin
MLITPITLLLSMLLMQAAPPTSAEQAALKPATPSGCVTQARDFVRARQRELAPLTSEKVEQSIAEKVTLAKTCAAQFETTKATMTPAELVSLAELYLETGEPARTAATLTAVLARQDVPAVDRANALAQMVSAGLAEPKGDARNARLEKLSDQLDALGAAAFTQQWTVHNRMMGFYRADDIDAGIIKHATWIINASKAFTPEQEKTMASSVGYAYVNMAQAWAGQGMTDKALALLKEGDAKWCDFPLRPGVTVGSSYFEPEIARLKLVGTPAAAIKAPVWFNGQPTNELSMEGSVTLLEFTAHWCGPCRESYPGVNRLRAKYGSQGFRVVLATQLYGYFKTEQKLAPEVEIARDKAYFAEHEMGDVPVAIGNQTKYKVGADKRVVMENGKPVYESGPDPNDAAYKVGGIPQIHLIDKKGIIRLIMVGYDDANEEKLVKIIEALLKEK